MSIVGKKFEVLDKGHVILCEYMGNDRVIDTCARGSYTGGDSEEERTDGQVRRLNRYLVRHKHTTPFEHVRMRFHIKVPIFIWRQWVRHRMATISEKSGRYVELDEWYVPRQGDMRKQHVSSKQASTEEACESSGDMALVYTESCERSFHDYSEMLYQGVSKEQARGVLPLSAYTEAFWTTDLHNLMHFLQLRLDTKAQFQFRAYAQVIAGIVEELFPITWESFRDFRLEAATFSRVELQALGRMLSEENMPKVLARMDMASKGEKDEFVNKLLSLT